MHTQSTRVCVYIHTVRLIFTRLRIVYIQCAYIYIQCMLAVRVLQNTQTSTVKKKWMSTETELLSFKV